MPSNPDALLISLPFAEKYDSAQSARYYWHSNQRGNEPFVIIQRTLTGSGVFEIGGKAWPVPPQSAFIAIIPENSIYYFPKEAEVPWSFSWINFYGALGVSLAREFRNTFGPVVPLPERTEAARRYHRLALPEDGKIPDPHQASAASYAFLMEWAGQLTRPMQQEGDPVETALKVCAQRFREPLGIKELASMTGLTREHFTRLFTARTGQSPARHLRDLRVAAAREMMQTRPSPHSNPDSEVALRCGFPSLRSLRAALAES
jgi:AraC-like DNA-binding protein